MARSVRSRLQLKTVLIVTLLTLIGGGAYGVSLGSEFWVGASRGAVTALFISMPVLLFEVYIANGPLGTPLRRGPLWRWLAIKTSIYVGVIALGETATWLLFSEAFDIQTSSYWEGMRATLIFSIPAAFAINAVFVIRQMLGAGTMASLLFGRYHRPRQEDLVFVFIDLVGSTSIAEKIGPVRFFELLNRFVYDVSTAIVEQRGRIYRYVGDEVIAVWPLGNPEQNSQCIAAWRDAVRNLERSRDDYQREFGFVPAVRCAIHSGTVVTGEMGDLKREITYLGDAVNTTARIEQACKARNAACLASAAFLEKTALPEGISRRSIGAVPLAGKEKDIPLDELSISG